MPGGGLEAGLGLFRGNFPAGFHGGAAVALLLAGAVEGGGAGVDQVQEAAGSGALELVAGHALDRLCAPVGADIGEDGCGMGEQVDEEHGDAVERVVFGGHDVGGADPVPVERRGQDGLQKIAVGQVVCPLALALESGGDGVAAMGFFAVAEGLEFGVADHQVAGDQGHLDRACPVLVFFGAAALLAGGIVVLAFWAVGAHPAVGVFELFRVIDAAFHAAHELDHVDRLDAQAEPAFQEIVVDDRAADPHADASHAQVGFAAHAGDCQPGLDKAQQFFLHIGGD